MNVRPPTGELAGILMGMVEVADPDDALPPGVAVGEPVMDIVVRWTSSRVVVKGMGGDDGA